MARLLVLLLLGLGLAQEAQPEAQPAPAQPAETPAAPVAPVAAAPVAPPPAAPVAAPVAPAAPVELPEAPADLEGDDLISFYREAHLESLASANIIGRKGAWLYGDYINGVPNVSDAVACATTCEKDEKCYHWNFQVVSKRCDLKAMNGGINQDISDWITGHATRYLNPPPIMP